MNLLRYFFWDTIASINFKDEKANEQIARSYFEEINNQMPRDRFGNEELLKKLNEANGIGQFEPYFVLRAQDAFSGHLVKLWADMAEAAGTPHDKVVNARECARAMRNWPKKKIPD